MAIVHRDVTPANIQLCRTGDAKLLDFGVAQLRVSQDVECSQRIRGTVTYMSPEMLGDQSVTAASDVFQLGVVMYEAITGTRPFAGKTEDEIVASQLKPPLFNFAWQPEFAAVVKQCLSVDPRDRASSNQLADQLASLCHTLSSATSRDMAKWIESEFASELSKHDQLESQNLEHLRDVCANAERTAVLQAKDTPSSALLDHATSMGTSLRRRVESSRSPEAMLLNNKPKSNAWQYIATIGVGAVVAIVFAVRGGEPAHVRPVAADTDSLSAKPLSASIPSVALTIEVPSIAVVVSAETKTGDAVAADAFELPEKRDKRPHKTAVRARSLAVPSEVLPTPATPVVTPEPITPTKSPTDLRDPWLRN
jgi:serine/threonine protein kinase